MGEYDAPQEHVSQSIDYDNHVFTDENFPPRHKVMMPRLQAKIPKCFGWQLAPDYDYYLWLDGNFILSHEDSMKHFYDNCQGHDMVVLLHPKRPNIRQEFRYVRRGMHQSSFLQARYQNELLEEQWEVIQADKDYKDDLLLSGGMFMYKNTPAVQSALKEWWHHITRYEIMDQLAFPYVLKKAKLNLKILSDNYGHCWYVKGQGHAHRRR